MTVLLVVLTTIVFVTAPALARPTLPFGVRVPAARVADPVIVRARRRYTGGTALVGVAACVAVVAAQALDWHLGSEPVISVLTVCYCLLGYRAHRSVVAGKRAGDWYAGTRPGVTTDTSLRTDPERPQWILLSPAVVLLLVTGAVGTWRYAYLPPTLPTPNGVTVDAGRRTATTVSFAFATVTAQFLVMLLAAVFVAVISRARPELDAEQPATSAARYRAYRAGVLRLLLISAGCANASLFVASLQVWELFETTVGITLVSYLPLAAAAAFWVRFALRVGDAGHRLPVTTTCPDRSRYVQRDDDRFWHAAGMIYVNRHDPAVLVHRRAGMVWTLNLGNPISWALVAGIVLVASLTRLDVVDLPVRGG